MMNRSIVMTDVGDCERAMARRGECDGAYFIGTIHGDAMRPQPRERLGRGMAVAVPRADADDRLYRPQLVEPAIRRRPAGAVMSYLQHADTSDAPRQMRLGGQPGVACEQQSGRSVRHQQNERLLVDIRLPHSPRGVRTQHLDGDPVQLQPVPAPRCSPLGTVPLYRAEKAEVAGVRHGLARLQHEGWVERVEHCMEPAVMIEMRMCGHDNGYDGGAVPAQERHDDSPPGIALWTARTAVDEHPATRWTPQRHRIALPNVQETYGKTLTLRKECEAAGQRRPRHEHADERDPGRDEPTAARRIPKPPCQ